ncbi:MAG TPA: hypothetical protein VMD53_04455 [Rhizomicrobium sp.]|nr:hypothetical protein [Rhizomicrobium sp.]
MRFRSAGAAIVLGCVLALSACDTDPADGPVSGSPDAVVAIGDAGATLIGAITDPCKLDPGDPFWKQQGGQEGYEQRCGHLPPD